MRCCEYHTLRTFKQTLVCLTTNRAYYSLYHHMTLIIVKLVV